MKPVGHQSYLEACRAPVDEGDLLALLDVRDGAVDVFGDDVAAVQQAAGHVLPHLRVALYLHTQTRQAMYYPI